MTDVDQGAADPAAEAAVSGGRPAASEGRSPTGPAGSAEPSAAAAPAGQVNPAADLSAVGAGRWRAPRTWRFLLVLARLVVMPVARLRVSGEVPAALRAGPVIFAVNHIGP